MCGWQGYQAHQAEQAVAASNLFQSMLINTRSLDVDKAREYGQQIVTNYANTDYAIFSAMIMAMLAVEEGDLAASKQHLEFAVNNADDSELKSLAILRLERVAYAEGHSDKSISLLSTNDLQGYVAAASELKGDIYAHKGDFTKAREEYALALSELTPGTGNYELLEMKLDSTGSNNVN